jgi:hypothetical protein
MRKVPSGTVKLHAISNSALAPGANGRARGTDSTVERDSPRTRSVTASPCATTRSRRKPPVTGTERFRGFPGAKTFCGRLRTISVSVSGDRFVYAIRSLPVTRFSAGWRRVRI